jgi:hypothetical protein
MIINLTQHPATAEQLSAGVVDLPADELVVAKALLDFADLPSAEEVDDRADALANLVAMSDLFNEGSTMGTRVMIGGAPFLMEPLARALRCAGLVPVFAFSRRESEEQTQPDGSVRKVAVFRHQGFVDAPGAERLVSAPVRDFAIAMYGSLKAFADAQDVAPQLVTKWINGSYIVDSGVLYSPRRELDPPKSWIK